MATIIDDQKEDSEPCIASDVNMDATEDLQINRHEQKAISICAQTASNLDCDEEGNLWRLPLPFSISRKQSTPQDLWLGRYEMLCKKISVNWKSPDAKTWLPVQLLKTTPYSFTLLQQLSTLSRHTKGQRLDALIAIQETRDQRLLLAESQQSILHQTYKGTAGVEDEYIQRVDGVMRKDMNQVISHFKGIKTEQKLQRNHTRQQNEQQQAVARARSRRQAKAKAQIRIQQELHRETMLNPSVELVGVEWSSFDGAGEQDHTTTQWNSSRSAKKKGREMRRFARMRSVHASVKPRTKEELTSSFRVDDIDREWDSESDEDVDENDRSLKLADIDAEPVIVSRRMRNKRLKKKQAQQRNAATEEVNKLDMSMEVADENDSDTSPPLTQAQRREASRRHAKQVLADVAARSIQLPSERIDLSMMGRLEKESDQKQISGMLDGLNAIAMDIDKKSRPVSETQ